MARFIFILLLICIVWQWVKRHSTLNGKAKKGVAVSQPIESIVKCDVCQTYVPEHECTQKGGKRVCQKSACQRN